MCVGVVEIKAARSVRKLHHAALTKDQSKLCQPEKLNGIIADDLKRQRLQDFLALFSVPLPQAHPSSVDQMANLVRFELRQLKEEPR